LLLCVIRENDKGTQLNYFTAHIAIGTKNETTETFQAADIDSAIALINEKFPEQTFRLVRGKSIPQKEDPAAAKKKHINITAWSKKQK